MAPPFLKYSLVVAAISFLTFVSPKSDVYIIHMDHSAMPRPFSDHHNWYLATLASISDTSSKDTTSSRHIYSYMNSIHGFSARLTYSELESLKKHPAYISSNRDRPLKLHTTHTSQFLGLSHSHGAWPASNYGDDVIIGLVDTGIWPESESFNDAGMSQVPNRWKGKCVSDIHFNTSLCNKKLIGARYYNKGLFAEHPDLLKLTINSTRDIDGHGTHTSSIAAGSFVKGASYFGYANGTASGMAPGSRVAIYKAVWSHGVTESDVLAAIDQAITDGVDILSLSLGFELDDMFLEDDAIAIAAFAAMKKGIFVAAAAGNHGPLVNGAPWVITVGASTVDREFGGILTLGNGNQVKHSSLYPGNYSLTQRPIVFLDECESVQEMKKVRQKIIVCKDNDSLYEQVDNALSAGASGAIFITNKSLSDDFQSIYSSFPTAFVGLKDGERIVDYIKRSNDPKAIFEFRKTTLGTKVAPMVDDYSNRGPFARCQYILKPDLIAPGTSVLASWTPFNSVAKVGKILLFSKFNLEFGTSMSTPHVAGVAALIKKIHPDWSPAAIRSALMTTANPLDNTQTPIKDVANDNLPATPLDMGSGHIDPNKALDPGLIYDATAEDYIDLLCAMNYTKQQIKLITNSTYNCVNKRLDLNYPSFIAFFLGNSSDSGKIAYEFRRTLTNVGDAMSSYTAKLTPISGINVNVEPKKLVFKNKYDKLSYKLTMEGPKYMKEYVVHGSVSWVHDEGKYVVRSPIVATNAMEDVVRNPIMPTNLAAEAVDY